MSLPLLVLFCLGLFLEQLGQAQHTLLPKPSLQASPSALVPLDKSVILHCKGPPGVLYRLEKLKSDFYTDDSTFSISPMEQSSAGQYRCSYQKGSRWSPPSDLLELIATGVFSKPTLSALPSSPVPPGSDVILQCQNNYGYDRFALYKEGDSGPSKSPEMWYKADFPISTVTAIHSGTYRCYSFSSASPYLWSHPSDPLELVVKGTSVTPSSPPTELSSSAPETSKSITAFPEGSSSPTVLAKQYDTSSNLVRMCLGAVILLLLVGILVEDWHSRKKLLRYRVRAIQRPLPPLPQRPKSRISQDKDGYSL